MKISSLEIKNFKSIIDQRISGFSDLNMIFGVNNSGKSNLFEFISIVFAPKRTKEITQFTDDTGQKTQQVTYSPTPFHLGDIYNAPYLININAAERKCDFKIAIHFEDEDFGEELENIRRNDFFIDDDTGHKNIVSLEGAIIEKDKLSYRFRINVMKLNNNILIQRDQFDRFEVQNGITGGSENYISILDSLDSLVSTVPTNRNIPKSEKFIFESSEIKHNLTPNTFRVYLFDKFITAETNAQFVDFVDFIKRIPVPRRIRDRHPGYFDEYPLADIDLSFARMENDVALMTKSHSRRLPISNYGTGIQQMLLILSYVFFETPKIIVIEELELNLSVAYQELAIHYLREYLSSKIISQVFFSTHADPYNRNDFRQYKVTINYANGTMINLHGN